MSITGMGGGFLGNFRAGWVYYTQRTTLIHWEYMVMISNSPVTFGMAVHMATVPAKQVGLNACKDRTWNDTLRPEKYREARVLVVREATPAIIGVHDPQAERLTYLVRGLHRPWAKERSAVVLTGAEARIAKQRYPNRRSLSRRKIEEIAAVAAAHREQDSHRPCRTARKSG
ncbi:MAG: hypothetical protein AB7P76_00735 [Candidatus Melainabacteria bacterium]